MHTLPRRLVHRVVAGLALAMGAGASGHEFWIMPSDFSPEPGGLVRVQLFHGERFAGEVVARNTPLIGRFELVSGAGAAEVRGLHEASVSFVRAAAAGGGTIVYESREYINLLPADRFEAYLREEGLGEIARRREELGETASPGREAYVRCAKAIVTAGEASEGSPADGAVGLPLEIVLGQGVGAPASGPVVARVLFEGQPIAGLRVVAVHGASPDELVELITDADGRVAFPAPAAGVWMLTTLHMTRTEDRDDVDWKSYWASLTFARPEGE